MKRLLIVEDDARWAHLLQLYADRVGVQTLTVVSGQQAIDAIDRWAPDAVLLDVLLAGETGVALLQELRSHEDLASLPIVVCSSTGVTAAELAPFGIKNVLNKADMQPQQVYAAVREVLR